MDSLKRIIRKDEFISKLPGLFAYVEDNALGVSTLYSAYESRLGCYGKVVENMKLPDDVGVEDTENDVILADKGSTISYNTMITFYHTYYPNLNEEFISFVEDGIGKIAVPDEFKTTDHDLIAQYVYLANVKALYNDYVKMHKLCVFYQKRLPEDGVDAYMCCLCEKYERMGGDEMKDWLSSYLSIAEERANLYLTYAQNASPKLCLKFPIFLSANTNDIGIYNPVIEEWEAGRLYEPGDQVYYDGKVYTCIKQTSGDYDDTTELIYFPTKDFQEDEPEYCGTQPIPLEATTDSKLKSLRRSVNYFNIYNEGERPDSGKDWLFYYRRKQIENIETMNDDYGNILRYDKDNGGGNCGYDEIPISWDNSSNPYSQGTTVDNLMAYGDYLEDITAEDGTITFTYYIGAHLKATYEGCKADEDGLYHYYFSDFVVDQDNLQHLIKYTESYTYSTGGFQNIYTEKVIGTEDNPSPSASDIEFPEEYVLYELFEYDSESAPTYLIYYNEQLITPTIITVESIDDITDPQLGIVYLLENTYIFYMYYAGDDIDKLVLEGMFDDYVNGEYDRGGKYYTDDNIDVLYTKYEFDTSNSAVYIDKNILGQNIQVLKNITDYETTLENCKDTQNTHIYKEDYLMGISYAPSVDADVLISRGSTAAFEKFVKFSEVKSLDAMEEYSNGSFFNMIEDTN